MKWKISRKCSSQNFSLKKKCDTDFYSLFSSLILLDPQSKNKSNRDKNIRDYYSVIIQKNTMMIVLHISKKSHFKKLYYTTTQNQRKRKLQRIFQLFFNKSSTGLKKKITQTPNIPFFVISKYILRIPPNPNQKYIHPS